MSSLKTIEKKLIYTIRQELALDTLLDRYTEQSIVRTVSQHELSERLKRHNLTLQGEGHDNPTALGKVAPIFPKRDWYLAKTPS
jgi:hypothetical protein